MKLIFWRLTKFSLVFFVVFLVFVLNYMFFAWFLSRLTTTPKEFNREKLNKVYATSNGVHIDLIFHKNLLDEYFLAQLESVEGADYIAIGWGDKGFYLYTPSWAELKISTAIAAGFLPSKTILHLTHYKQLNPKWKSIELCDEQLEAMKKFVYASFNTDKTDKIQLLEGAGYRDNDFFYVAKGSYSCLYTCNIWVNQALKKASVKTAIWSPFDKGILRHL